MTIKWNLFFFPNPYIKMLHFKVGADSDDDEYEDDGEIPEAREQDGAEFGWFNDLYILDTGT